jgi:two-component system sensor histidine kinase/response regulator
MRRYLAAEQMQELQRLAHSLKGTTATLGASRLRVLAAELETRVKERQDSTSIEAGIAALEAEWRAFAPPLAAALASADQTQPDRVVSPSIDRDALRITLDRLEALLADDDMAVNAEYRQAAEELRTCFGNEVKQFEARLQAFDYTAALAWLRAQRAERGF